MYYILSLIIVFIVGFLTSFFIMRNNPKYFNLNKMGKAKLQELLDKVKGKLA